MTTDAYAFCDYIQRLWDKDASQSAILKAREWATEIAAIHLPNGDFGYTYRFPDNSLANITASCIELLSDLHSPLPIDDYPPLPNSNSNPNK
jgi:hypothetical protein